jgi:hypothetical protein
MVPKESPASGPGMKEEEDPEELIAFMSNSEEDFLIVSEEDTPKGNTQSHTRRTIRTRSALEPTVGSSICD